jgi:hypothetical protein
MKAVKGFGGLPFLIAMMPTKSARLTLSPFQQIVLHSLLTQALETPELFPNLAGDGMEEIELLEGELSDRLTFKQV